MKPFNEHCLRAHCRGNSSHGIEMKLPWTMEFVWKQKMSHYFAVLYQCGKVFVSATFVKPLDKSCCKLSDQTRADKLHWASVTFGDNNQTGA